MKTVFIGVLAWCAAAAASADSTALANSHSLQIIYSFQRDGKSILIPNALIRDRYGNLFGTTLFGGDFQGGTFFKLATDGTETVLYSFPQNSSPQGTLIEDGAGSLFGTTYSGGRDQNTCDYGCGTVYKVTAVGTEKVLYSFAGGSDGAGPNDGVTRDGEGNLYGTTEDGGGTTCFSGYGCGTVFKIDRRGNETILYRFQGGSDGADPIAGLLMDKAGNFYGTTYVGGGNASCEYGCGTIYKLTPDGSETILYSFTGGSDGAYPPARLIEDSEGDFFSTTAAGGADGFGVVFKLAADGTMSVLHAFAGGRDGQNPGSQASLVRDQRGDLFGTTVFGGGSGCKRHDSYGCGTVFKIDPTDTETVLVRFKNADHNAYPKIPWAGLIKDKTGSIFGTTEAGGTYRGGTIFELVK